MAQPHSLRPAPLALAVGAALSLSAGAVLAADRAGRVLTSAGPVVARTADGSTRSLSRGDRVYPGDLILTNRGRIQIRFRDGGLISLDPRSEFEIERYETESDAGAGNEDEGGSAIMNLFRGALRTITGAIGGGSEDTYRMNTPVATIGVRGTGYKLAYCTEGSCGSGVPDGLYGHVTEEGVFVENAGGSGGFAAGSFFRVTGENSPPQRILRPPGDLFRGSSAPQQDGDGERDGDGENGALGEGDGGDTGDTREETFAEDESTLTTEFSQSTETGAEVGTEGLRTLTGTAFAGAYVGGGLSEGGACISDTPCLAEVDADGNLRRIDTGTETVDATDPGVTLVESGTLASLDATWGRWQGDIVVDDGTGQTTVNANFPWAYSTNATTTTELSNVFSTAGTLTFNNFSGPSPVGSINGTDWSVSTLSVRLDIGGGTAVIGNNFDDVQLSLVGPGTVDLDSAGAPSLTIDPGNGDRGFAVPLQQASFGPDSGVIEATFAGDSAEGLVLQFEANDDSTGEVIEGVKIVTQ